MSFNVHKWNKQRYLAEAGLLESIANQTATVISKAIETVDENLSYKDFALAVAKILKDEYGSQNFDSFMEVLHAELDMKESLNEDKESLGKEFSDKFKIPASSDEDSITIRTKDIIEDPTAERMINWIESKGYIVDRKRSSFDYDYEPGERDFWPRIRFDKK
jgi:hypothetical protein